MTPQPAVWWQGGTIYQIYPRSFNDSNGDGIGDLQGIIDRLDYLKGGGDSLDVDAIWISPIYPSPMADFGYDIADYRAIDPRFGDLATFDRLLEEAHRRDLRVILDFVPNHTSDEHPWFVESRASRDNPKRDWYIWRDPKADGSPPNNWVSMFGGRAWTWDETTQQYYLHLFHTKQPDLNWRNPVVVKAMLDILRFWLDRGVDGFRIDVVGFIIKDAALRDNPLTAAGMESDALDEWHHLEHRYDIDQPEVHEFIRQFRALHDEYGALVIGEIWIEPRSRWVKYYGKNGDGLHLPFNFGLLCVPWEAIAIRQSVAELESMLQPRMWPNYVLGSHDMSRLATRYGQPAVRLAALLLLTLRGTPTLYMGDELGMVDGDIPQNKMQDPQGLNLGPDKSRDPCRTPFQWSAEAYAGFSTAEPWLPVAAGYEDCNMTAELADSHSVLNLYRTLLRLRKANMALQLGDYQAIDSDQPDCLAYLRQDASACYLIVLNFSAADITPRLKTAHTQGQIIVSTLLDRQTPVTIDTLTLRPYEGLIIQVLDLS